MRQILKTTGIIIFVVFLLFMILLPMPQLSPPSGKYPVGTTYFDWTDPLRPETFTEDPFDKREIAVQIFYPSEKVLGAKRAPIIANLSSVAKAFGQKYHLPAFIFNYLYLIKTHSFLDTPLAKVQEKFPVIVFSHGFGGIRNQSTYLLEELASHGYIVVALDHTYDALFTVFSNGRVELMRAYLPPDLIELDYKFTDYRKIRTADVMLILSKIQGLNQEEGSLFFNRLDLEDIGIFGHSAGGTTTLEACRESRLLKACAGLDAFPESGDATGILQPMMLFDAAAVVSYEGENRAYYSRLYSLFRNLTNDSFLVTIQNFNHNNFTDAAFFKSPLVRLIPDMGRIDGKKGMFIVRDYLIAFFDTYLKNQDFYLLDENYKKYSEVSIQVRRKL